MKQTFFTLALTISSGVSLLAHHTPDEPNGGFDIDYNYATDEALIDWYAFDGYYYFLEQNEHLNDHPWTFFPYAVMGQDDVEGVAVSTNTDRMFYRLIYTNDPDSPLLTDDFDNDGILNIDELGATLNIYDNSDLDLDLVPDDWERFHRTFFINADNDGDGRSNFEEYNSGEDPNEFNTDIPAPTLAVGSGNYTIRSGVYELNSLNDKLAVFADTTVANARVHYTVTAPHLEPRMRFDGSGSSPIAANADPTEFDPRASAASILRLTNGIYTIRAKIFVDHDGKTYESPVSELTIKVRPLPSGSPPNGTTYLPQAYYNINEELWYSISSQVPSQHRRQTSDGWLVEPQGSGYAAFIPDLTTLADTIFRHVDQRDSFSTLSSDYSSSVRVTVASGWCGGNTFYTNFNSTPLLHYGDHTNGNVTFLSSDIPFGNQNVLGVGWMTAKGFRPNFTQGFGQVYAVSNGTRVTNRVTGSGVTLPFGWIGGWMDSFHSADEITDSDRDGIADAAEHTLGLSIATQPSAYGPKDSDGDGVLDYIEAFQGSDPMDIKDLWPRQGGSSFTTSTGQRIPQAFDQSDFVEGVNGQSLLYLRKINGSNAYGAPLERGTEDDHDWIITVGETGSPLVDSIIVLVDALYYSGVYPSHYHRFPRDGYLFQIVYPNAGNGVSINNRIPTFHQAVGGDLPTPTGETHIAVNMATGRTELGLDVGPQKGVGKYRITQSNDKIRVWDAETDGSEITSPSAQSKSYLIGDAALNVILNNQRLWIEGLQTSSSPGDTEILVELLDENNNLIKEVAKVTITVLSLDLTGHRPGGNGAVISETDEDDPDNLLLMTNDDFDEGNKDDENLAIKDWVDNQLDIANDPDYMRIILSLDTDLDTGTVRLLGGSANAFRLTDPGLFFKVFTEDGQTRLRGNDFELNLNNLQGPLSDLATLGEVTLLAEATTDGAKEMLFKLQYELGELVVEDDVHLHIIDVDFEEAAPFTGFDDNDDQIGPLKANPALMVPLNAAGEGSNLVKVNVKPSALRDRIRLTVFDSTVATAPETIPADGLVSIVGQMAETTQIFASFTGQGAELDNEAARMYIDVKPRLTDTKTVKVFDLRQQGGSSPAGPGEAAIQAYLDETWGAQANIFNTVDRDVIAFTVDYDKNGDGAMPSQNAAGSEVKAVIDELDDDAADINIFYVHEVLGRGAGFHASTSQGKSYIFVEATALLGTTGHEYGHGLGLNGADGEGHSESDTDVMGPQNANLNKKQIRRYDWSIANPISNN